MSTLKELKDEIGNLRIQYEEAEETISAIQSGSIDALVVNGSSGTQIYTLEGADYPYRVFIETMSEGAAILSIDYDVLYCNGRMAEMLELPKEKIIGNPIHDFICPEERTQFNSIVNGEKKTNKGELRITSESGKEIIVLLSYTPLDLEKTLGCLLFTDLTEIKKVQDELKSINENLDKIVTERTWELQKINQELSREIQKRIKTEKILKESEEKFKLVVNAIPQLAWVADKDGLITWYNNRWYDYSGTNFDQMKGYRWQSLHDPDVLPKFMEKWEISITSGEPFEMIFPLRGKDHNYREFLTRMIPVKDGDGRVIQWFGTNTDITEIKRIEKELQQSRERLNMALENGNTGIWEWDLKTDQITLDERIKKMFQVEIGSEPMNFNEFENLINEEDIPHIKAAISRSVTNDCTFETIFRTRLIEGEMRYITSKGLVTKNETGEISGMIGVAFDVTEMKKDTEQLLIKLNEELLRSNRELEQFAYIASHDLQEPLRMVSNFTQLLAKKYLNQLDENAREYIHYIVDGANRMQGLINGLLAYSRVQTRGKNFTEVNMKSVLDHVQCNLWMQIHEKNAQITIDDLPCIYADEGQMIQLMQNLVLNALKFSKGIPQIRISAQQKSKCVIFSVKDKGIGIEEQYFKRIFQIFQRLWSKNEYEGMGIGLAICKRIVERHNGEIWVESELGKGSDFFFSIPLPCFN
jgi:PAS domain S-box-containing protein